jgi:Trp operon repressor
MTRARLAICILIALLLTAAEAEQELNGRDNQRLLQSRVEELQNLAREQEEVLAALKVTIAKVTASSNSSTTTDTSISEDRYVKQVNFGTDTSWPMQYMGVSTNYPWLPHNVNPENFPIPDRYKGMPLQLLGDRQKVYDDFMQGCQKHAEEYAPQCIENEILRIKRCLEQPPQMTNYTATGFKKIRAPEEIFKLIKDFWEANKHLEKN